MKSILLAVLLAAAASPAAASDVATFRVGTVELKALLPSGYCAPEGKDAAVAQVLATGDTRNVTHLTAISCDSAKAWMDYFILKTPNELLLITTTNTEIQEAVGPALEAADISQDVGEAAKSLSRTMGSEVQIKGQVRGHGRDQHCLYLGAILDMKAPERGIEYTLAMSGCMTVIEGKMITIYRYAPGKTTADIRKLMPSVLAFAKTISPIAAK